MGSIHGSPASWLALRHRTKHKHHDQRHQSKRHKRDQQRQARFAFNKLTDLERHSGEARTKGIDIHVVMEPKGDCLFPLVVFHDLASNRRLLEWWPAWGKYRTARQVNGRAHGLAFALKLAVAELENWQQPWPHQQPEERPSNTKVVKTFDNLNTFPSRQLPIVATF